MSKNNILLFDILLDQNKLISLIIFYKCQRVFYGSLRLFPRWPPPFSIDLHTNLYMSLFMSYEILNHKTFLDSRINLVLHIRRLKFPIGYSRLRRNGSPKKLGYTDQTMQQNSLIGSEGYFSSSFNGFGPCKWSRCRREDRRNENHLQMQRIFYV